MIPSERMPYLQLENHPQTKVKIKNGSYEHLHQKEQFMHYYGNIIKTRENPVSHLMNIMNIETLRSIIL